MRATSANGQTRARAEAGADARTLRHLGAGAADNVVEPIVLLVLDVLHVMVVPREIGGDAVAPKNRPQLCQIKGRGCSVWSRASGVEQHRTATREEAITPSGDATRSRSRSSPKTALIFALFIALSLRLLSLHYIHQPQRQASWRCALYPHQSPPRRIAPSCKMVNSSAFSLCVPTVKMGEWPMTSFQSAWHGKKQGECRRP